MTRNFESNSNFEHHSPAEASPLPGGSAPVPTLNSLHRDRFELISAYLDGEVSASERKQVEDWLASDPVAKRLYKRLLTLRQGLQTLPVPATTQTSQQVTERVLQRLERRFRWRLVWGGGAIAALLLGGLSTILEDRAWAPQIAQVPLESPTVAITSPVSVSSDALMIAIDRPIVEIPKAPVSTPVRNAL